MHETAYKTGKSFFELYWKPGFHNIVDFGSGDINGSLRDHCPAGAEYTGLDMEAGPGVDVCISPHAPLPLSDEFADVVVSSSVFEHDELFWETFLELVRITRRGGFLYVSAPSNGHFHRHPVDCWRFYPDASTALVKWAKSKGLEVELVESFILRRGADVWNDFVAIFHRPGETPLGPQELLSDRFTCANVKRGGQAAILREESDSEDTFLLKAAQRERDTHEKSATTLQRELLQAQEQLASAQEQLASTQARLAAVQSELDLARMSTSWRVTAPLRTVRSYLLQLTGRPD